MKNLLFTLCLFFVVTSFAWSQSTDEESFLASIGNPENSDYGELNMIRGKNSVELGFGAPHFNAYIMDIDMFNHDDLILDFGGADRMCHEWFQDEVVQTRRRCTWAFNANYMRAVKWWLQLGVSFSSSAYRAEYEKGYTREYSFVEKSFVLSCIPTARFNYRNRKYFGLYSEFGAGFYFLHEENHNYRNAMAKPKNNECNFMAQVTLLGVHVGGKLYAYGEIGFGPKGFLSTGVGYRF